jgi:hypothetical protein
MSLLIQGLNLNVFKVGWFDINAGGKRFIEYHSVSHFLGKTPVKRFVKTLLLSQVFKFIFCVGPRKKLVKFRE